MGRVALTAAVICALLPASADGAVRYASSTIGAGADCTEASPCTLETAVTGASASDEVVVGPGTYALGATLEATVPLTIHGAAGQPRPSIAAAPGIVALHSDSTIGVADLAFQSRNADTLFLAGPSSTAERIEAVATSDPGRAALRAGNGFVLRNSLLRSYGAGADALFYQATETSTVTLRNVTAFASGTGSKALEIFANANAPGASIEATNVIAEAALDLFADADPSTSAAIHVTNSNFSSGDPNQGSIGGQNNQPQPPLFANAAAGDFRQAPGSPTIDAGLTDPADAAPDLDGNPRVAGAATDIGAYEFLPAAPAGAPVDSSAAGTVIGRLRLSRRGVVSATLACPAGESRCRWAYSLRSRRSVRTRGKRRVVRFGGGTASAAGGRRVTVRIKLSKRNFRLIKRKRRLSVKLTVRTTDTAANVATTKRTATLKAPKRAARRSRATPWRPAISGRGSLRRGRP